jgi:hypothetical protein
MSVTVSYHKYAISLEAQRGMFYESGQQPKVRKHVFHQRCSFELVFQAISPNFEILVIL